jgi:hypothetical protein
MKTSMLLLILSVLWASCNKQPSTLTQVQQQRSGDYLVTLFNDSGVVKQRSNKFVVEIRNAATNEPANVSNVKVQATMRMPGASPMFADVSAARAGGSGRYEFDADFSMAGQWSLLLTFDPNGRVQLNLNAQ